ncbi:MAG: (Fe-S)-binding protein, partial [Dehalococcoidia bacterium]|nr:(Fe-S)-binding protein [Dehalococcoidia bacterium]
KSARFARACPSIEYCGFQAYSLGGRLSVGLSLLEGRIGYNDELKNIVWECQLDGACDVSDKICRYNIRGLEAMREMRFKLVEDGQTLPRHRPYIDSLHKEKNMMMEPKTKRGKWAERLDIKDLTREKAAVVFHAGCRYSYDKKLQKKARTTVTLLRDAGVDIGIMGENESCCGGRAYQWGYRKELDAFARKNARPWTDAGVKTVVTPCAECYHTFKRLYPEIGFTFEVVHVVEYMDRLIKRGKMKLTRSVPLTVTYHDPCHLGRLGEPYVPWQGTREKIYGQIPVWKPSRPRYTGARGVYDAPRNVLKIIPGLTLVEMERTKEYAWCCGAGGGVLEAYPDFAAWTAAQRLTEARATSAEAIVSACPWCERNFADTAKGQDEKIKVYDVVDLVQMAL